MKSYDQTIQHTKKQRHYFANKGPFSQSYIFSSSHIWMWELEYKESWALYNWCFWTVVLEKTLENSWTAGRSNESIRKEISPEYSLEDWCWNQNSQYFGHMMQNSDSLEKTLMLESLKAGGEGDDRECYGWMASPIQWTWVWASSGIWWLTGKPGVLQSMGSQRVGHNWATELNWYTHTHIDVFL